MTNTISVDWGEVKIREKCPICQTRFYFNYRGYLMCACDPDPRDYDDDGIDDWHPGNPIHYGCK